MFEPPELTVAPRGHLRDACPSLRIVKVPAGREFVALEMTAGRAYTAVLAEHPEQPGARRVPRWLAVYDAAGAFLVSTTGGAHRRSPDTLCTFTPSLGGTHYIEARGCSFSLGAPDPGAPDPDPRRSPAAAALSDARARATDLGDITGLCGSNVPVAHPHGKGEPVSFVRFVLSRSRLVSLALVCLETHAELFLENAGGAALCGRTHMGSGHERVSATLGPGTYFARIRMPRCEGQPVLLRHTVSGPPEGIAQALERQTPLRRDPTRSARANGVGTPSGPVNGSAARVSLGALPIPDSPRRGARHSLVGGNESGLFRLDERTGELCFTGTEADVPRGTTEFALSVRTEDGERSEDRSVTVSVTNAATLSAEMHLGTESRVSLGRVSEPVPRGAGLRYRLVGGNESGLFELDEDTGELFFTGAAEDLEEAETGFKLTVRVDPDRH